MSKVPHIVVVGAGIAGLACAYKIRELAALEHRSVEVTLVESSDRLGGVIATKSTRDFVVELGPDSFISEKPWALQLCQRLGIEGELVQTNTLNRSTFVVCDGELLPLPAGFLLLAPTQVWSFVNSSLFSFRGKLRMALDLLMPRGKVLEDESLGSFVRRRLGKEALERVAQPLVGGIYTADPEHLSLAATMPRFLEMEKNYRSVIYALWKQQRQAAGKSRFSSGPRWSLFVSLKGGMERLVEKLNEALSGVTINKNCSVTEIRHARDVHSGRPPRWEVEIRENKNLLADGVVLATPSYVAAECLRPLSASLSERLFSITYNSSATVNFAYPRGAISQRLDGFGFVVPKRENRKILAATFSSMKYPNRAPEGSVLLRTFLGGALQPELLRLDDANLIKAAQEEIAALMGVTANPEFATLARWPKAMPSYGIGHLNLVQEIESRLEGLSGIALAGAAYRGVGIPDCVRSGELAAEVVYAGCW